MSDTSSGFPRRQDAIIITAAVGAILGLMLATRGEVMRGGMVTPVLSANDLSRWATVYSLVERGTYNIDESPWRQSIDRVRLGNHTYSSKPPLLSTIVAGECYLLKKISFGKLSLDASPATVIRISLIATNLIPLVLFLLLYSHMLDRLAVDGWARSYSMSAAALGTFLTLFSITLNNHTVAACSAAFAMFAALRIWFGEERKWWLFASAGFFAGFSAVTEFPALAYLGLLLLCLFRKAPRQALLIFLPCALIPIAGHFTTNYLEIGSLRPAYADKKAYDFPGSYWKIDPASGRLVGSRTDPITGKTVLHNNIDGQYEPWHVYLFHLLIGHHGIFSLTPIFVLSFLGIFATIRSRADPLRVFAMLALVLTLILLIFYVFFAGQRNYGGATSGPRWFFWLIPQWLIFLPRGLRLSSRPWFHTLALLFLIVSAASVFYPGANPWSRSWLHAWMSSIGWIHY